MLDLMIRDFDRNMDLWLSIGLTTYTYSRTYS